MSERASLCALANRLGIENRYHSALDESIIETSDSTREALCFAMGHDASSETMAARALVELDRRETAHWIEPVAVVGETAVEGLRLRATSEPRALEWRVCVELENGARLERQGRSAAGQSIPLPEPLPSGYHDLTLELETPGGPRTERQRRIVTPNRCWGIDAAFDGALAFGLWANLYSVRSRRPGSWGFGDFGDLKTLVGWAAREGAAFVGLNPLHAVANRNVRISPYSPWSRLFRNELYLELEAIPEWRHSAEVRQLANSPALEAHRSRLREAERLAPDQVMQAKRPVLERLHRCFCEREHQASTARGREYDRYCAAQGPALQAFATFAALADHFAAARPDDRFAVDWRCWPEAFRDPESAEVRHFRDESAQSVAFHTWVQFELDRQLSEIAADGDRRGLAVGLYTDLALGSAADGSDVWCWPSRFARAASVGAPPDAFSQQGQDWSFPPLQPAALRADGYAYWTQLLRSAFAHAGALRIDHILGLRRLWWIPAGQPPAQGAYVTYPEEAMLGILALESARAAALVIGEDLGTVPPGFSEALQRRGVLSSSVLLFERSAEGFRRPGEYSPRTLVTANTHDLPPLAAFVRDTDLGLRRDKGQIPDDAALAAAHRERESDRCSLAARLSEAGLWDKGGDSAGQAPLEEWAAAVTRFLSRTPCAFLGVSLDDLAGETEPINLPGVPPERHASWTRRMGSHIEDLPHQPLARATLDAVGDRRRNRKKIYDD